MASGFPTSDETDFSVDGVGQASDPQKFPIDEATGPQDEALDDDVVGWKQAGRLLSENPYSKRLPRRRVWGDQRAPELQRESRALAVLLTLGFLLGSVLLAYALR